MEKVYIFSKTHSYSYLLENNLVNKAFKTRERCEEIVKNICEKKYGKPMFSENSVFVKLVKQYWAGDFSMEELEEKIGNKKTTDTAFNSALYYDFKNLFWIEEYEITE